MKDVKVVCALIKNKYGKYFICKRGKGKALEGYWEFPGGKVEEHETYEQTIVREIKEELHSTVKPLKYVGISEYTYEHIEPFNPFHITMYGYICELIEGKLELTEHSDARWVSAEEMKSIQFAPADIYFVNELISE